MPSESIGKQIFGDLQTSSAAKQICFGLGTGWLSGVVFINLGETIAIALGGGILLLKVAEQQGYITIHMTRQTQREHNFNEQLGNLTSSATHWYTNLIGDEHGKHINELHLFIAAFISGAALALFKPIGTLFGCI